MIQNLKKETFVNRILTWVAVGSLVVGIMIYYNYMDGDIPITGILPYKTITTCSDLSKFKGRRVEYTITDVAFHVVNFWESNDPTHTVYTSGYYVFDASHNNMFCVFVPVHKSTDMDLMQGELVFFDDRDSISVHVKGLVRRLSDRNLHYAQDAMTYYYKTFFDTDAPILKEVYYIDDENIAKGPDAAEVHTLLSIWFTVGVLYLIVDLVKTIVRAGKVPELIDVFCYKNHCDRNMLEQEYLTAKEFPGSIRISRNFTFYNGKSGFGILLNRKISNAVTHSKRHGNRIHHYLRIDNERGELYDDIRITNASSGETILDYLKSICPQIGAKDYEPYTYDAQRLANVFANPDSAAFGDAPDDKQ